MNRIYIMICEEVEISNVIQIDYLLFIFNLIYCRHSSTTQIQTCSAIQSEKVNIELKKDQFLTIIYVNIIDEGFKRAL